MSPELIQKIVAAESEARSVVESARKEAERIRLVAEKQARSLMTGGREQWRHDREELVARVAAEAQEERDRRVEDAARELESELSLDEELRRRIVEAVVRCACGLPERRGEEAGSHA